MRRTSGHRVAVAVVEDGHILVRERGELEIMVELPVGEWKRKEEHMTVVVALLRRMRVSVR